MGWVWGKWEDVSQRVQTSTVKWISSGDLTWSMGRIINNTLLHTWKFFFFIENNGIYWTPKDSKYIDNFFKKENIMRIK